MALSNNPDAEYLLFVIDKDFIDIHRLQDFIDYLQKKKPTFGYLDLYALCTEGVENFSAGREAMTKLGYLGKHPSGYF